MAGQRAEQPHWTQSLCRIPPSWWVLRAISSIASKVPANTAFGSASTAPCNPIAKHNFRAIRGALRHHGLRSLRRRRHAGTRIDSSALPVRTEGQKDGSGEGPSGSSLLLLASDKVASSRRTFLPAGRREQSWWLRNANPRNAQDAGRSAQRIIRIQVCCR